jgi:hypothetical protein
MTFNPMQAYPAAAHILAELLRAIQAVLGEKLAAFYVYGSFATGDFTEGISDLDTTAVLKEELDEEDLAKLAAMHADFASRHPAWRDRIETQYVSVSALRNFCTVRHPMANISPGEPFHLIEGGAEWLSNWWMIRVHGITLYGAPPTEVIPPIADEEFFDVIASYVREAPEWALPYTAPGSQAYTILTMCRALFTLRHRRHTSKQAAAIWAREAYPQWADLIDKAVYWRENSATTQDDPAAFFPRTLAFVDFAVKEAAHITQTRFDK